ncbi:Npun_F0296 family exosortase-dependent surface protein [Meridianimarinicoccus aquatilis]|uniref:VPLPA-CTERM sorting domain-containing protein n=1 Tax=Meridianimarinicoccus aquatilis TaxID=2552766 RepID=A0A4V3BBF0_9RHOB|nr:VPLPA-CTERM sorting domain-containing protein [Fluviibacterium aquatile]TDL86849.1 hypothetical protein E2L05_12635 [Fluviibacterium aquatile]
MKILNTLLAALVIATPVVTHAASVTVTIEDAGVLNADLAGIGATGSAVETFDSVALGKLSGYTSVLGTYSAGQVNKANVYGGAEETPYFYVQNTPGSTLTLNTPATYLGFWWSAGSGGNQVELLSGSSSIFSFNTNDVVSFIKTNAEDPESYYGNPNEGYLGKVSHEPFAFINIFSDMSFDSIVFSGGNFESDNHTIAESYTGFKGTNINPSPAPVPLPAPFALLAGGVAAIAFVKRRSRIK